MVAFAVMTVFDTLSAAVGRDAALMLLGQRLDDRARVLDAPWLK